MKLEKYTFGVGDRFARQGKAQLRAMIMAKEAGWTVAPVWNKSNREHSTIHSVPGDVRAEADAAVKTMGWTGAYYVDADHIGLKNVDLFMDAADFFTLDVADFTGHKASEEELTAFTRKYENYIGDLRVPGAAGVFRVTKGSLRAVAENYLLAVKEAGKIYRRVAERKGPNAFITEVSMDETNKPQTPEELFFILAMIADEKIPARTIAPKFSGRFNKGVDYVGDVAAFASEFDLDLSVIAFAIKVFGLPKDLKLSVHSGSDKFSIYRPIGQALKKHNAGLHLKTAGTTWLEEVIGLAMAGGEGLAIANAVYAGAMARFDELTGPYATVIDIDKSRLPSVATVASWSGEAFAAALRHVQSEPRFNPNFRQLVHVGYKVAAEMGARYTDALVKFEDIVGKGVTENIFERHIKRIFSELS